MAEEILNIGILVDESNKLIVLNDEKIKYKNFFSGFYLLKGSKYELISEVIFSQSERDSGKYDYFGLSPEGEKKVLESYKERLPVFFKTTGIAGYSDSTTEISETAFKGRRLKITLKGATQEEKVNFIKDDFVNISKNYLERFNPA